uniref:hypothetical protein n=1 Tax=Edaphosphingomonas laterariae TaxID=861865 RepID=UPI0015C5C169|nr:hypothetical protein [Sphingomonas laterariae]
MTIRGVATRCAPRALMADALDRLDMHSTSAAAATLDLALHHLDRELGTPHRAA